MEAFEFEAGDGKQLACYRWLPDGPPRAVIHIAHGMGEHAARYDWTARKLADAGYAVYANDHRGHGKTADVPGQFGDDGWNRMIADIDALIARHHQELPGVPVILFGHSMGSMLAEQYIELHGDGLAAVVLSGSPGFTGWLQGFITRLVVRIERWRVGKHGDSKVIQALLFGVANKEFENEVAKPTGFEWLSRDADQVRDYVDDPLCGFVPCPQSVFDLARGAQWTQRPEAVARIPRRLPIYLFSGDSDPVHNDMKNIERMLAMYRAHGLHVDTKFYEGGRHEMLNETNREEVIADLMTWLAHHHQDARNA